MTRNLKKNELVVYRKRRESCLGVVSTLADDKIELYSEDGKEITVDVKKVVLGTQILIEDSSNKSEIKSILREYRKRLESDKDSIDIKTLWECFENSEKQISFNELCELYESGNENDESNKLQLFWTVDKNDTYFKRENDLYITNTRKEVSEIIERKERQKRKEEEKDKDVNWIKNHLENKGEEFSGFDKEYYIDLLKDFVIKNDVLSYPKDVRSFFSEIGIKDPESATELLMSLDIWDEDADPDIKRLESLKPFPKSVSNEVEKILLKEELFAGHEDLTALEIFSVDDESTEDIDDAISVSFRDDQVDVGVHISNVSHYIEKWSSLDREAVRRGDTVYLPEGRIDIFPEELIKNKFSLFEGKPRSSLSLILTFNKDTYELKEYRFFKSKIVVNKNYTYAEAEKIFSDESWGSFLVGLAQNLREKRIANGAFILQLPELKIKTDEQKSISIKKNYMSSVAHFVIAELMIITNQISAKFLSENLVPAVFRIQTEEIPAEARELDREDPLFPIKVIKYLRPSRSSITPEKHSSLGLRYYLQSTSPIRRYFDIVVQRQILSVIDGESSCYETEELLDLVSKVGHGLPERRILQKNRNKFWLFKYFKLNQGIILRGVVSFISDRGASAYLSDYFLELPVSVLDPGSYNEGDLINLHIENVNPLRKKIKLVPKI